jgi:hypothetical protein
MSNTFCVTLDTKFDINRLVIEPPKKIGKEVQYYTSHFYYLDESGKKCDMYMELPPQMVFGVNYMWDMNAKEADKVPEKALDLQVAYPIMARKNHPTDVEQRTVDIFEALQDAVRAQTKDAAVRSYFSTNNKAVFKLIKDEDDEVVKPIFSASTKVDEKTGKPNDYPPRAYIKLMTQKKDKIVTKALTRFYDGEDNEINPIEYINVRGIISPNVKIDGIYWGAHGQSPYGASVQIKLFEAIFEPQASVLPPRMIKGGSRATAVSQPETEDVDTKTKPVASSGFAKGTNPLTAKAKKVAPKIVVPPPAPDVDADDAEQQDEEQVESEPPRKPTAKIITPAAKVVKPAARKPIKPAQHVDEGAE